MEIHIHISSAPCWVFFGPYFHSASAYECLRCTVCGLVCSCCFTALYWLLLVVILQHYISVTVLQCVMVAGSFYMGNWTVSVMSVPWCFWCMFSTGECKLYRYWLVNMAMEKLVHCLLRNDVYQLGFFCHSGFQRVTPWLESMCYFLSYAVKFPGMFSCK